MTSRLQQKRQLNTAGLEADVMRFMAIIAFCLIAMTAMVKEDHVTRPEVKVASQNHETSVASEILGQVEPMASSQTADDSEPLTLRFDTDKTFIHLIASGKLALFAKLKEGYFAMDQNFQLTNATPSGEFFEVMDTSIPSKIKHVFENTGSATIYLVKLPEESRRALKRFTRDNSKPASGTLVIHQNGSVSHES